MKWAEAVKAGGDVPPAYLAFTPTPRDTGSGVTGLLPPRSWEKLKARPSVSTPSPHWRSLRTKVTPKPDAASESQAPCASASAEALRFAQWSSVLWPVGNNYCAQTDFWLNNGANQ